MSFCKDCLRGARHEGTPTGKWEKLNGVDCYVATPTVDYPKDKVVLFLTDLFGPQFINCQLLVDDFAANGLKTIAPDYFDGDPAPVDGLEQGSSFDVWEWIQRHGQDVTRPLLDKVIEGLKAEGVTAIGAAGYCFGARYAFDIAFDHIPKVVAILHPSLLQVPEDIEKYISTAKAPILWVTAEHDERFTTEKQEKTSELFGVNKFEPGYKRVHFNGCRHGFSIRGDLNDPVVKTAKEDAFKAVVQWFMTYL